LDLRSVAVIRRIEKQNFVSGIDDSHDRTVEAFDSSVNGNNLGFNVEILESFAVKFGNGFDVVN